MGTLDGKVKVFQDVGEEAKSKDIPVAGLLAAAPSDEGAALLLMR